MPTDGLTWWPAVVPGTAAGALRDAGVAAGGDLDGQDWWFRTTFEAAPAAEGEAVVLRLDGLATMAEVLLNGERIARRRDRCSSRTRSTSATGCAAANELVDPLPGVGARSSRSSASRGPAGGRDLVADNNLRWFRTMLLGRIPGFAPGPPAVGPWRPVWLERRRGIVVDDAHAADRARRRRRRPARSAAAFGRSRARARRSIGVELDGPSGRHAAALDVTAERDDLAFSRLPAGPGRPALVAAHARRTGAPRRPPAGRDGRGADRRRGRPGRLPDARRGADRDPRHRAGRPVRPRQRRADLRPRRALDAARHRRARDLRRRPAGGPRDRPRCRDEHAPPAGVRRRTRRTRSTTCATSSASSSGRT